MKTLAFCFEYVVKIDSLSPHYERRKEELIIATIIFLLRLLVYRCQKRKWNYYFWGIRWGCIRRSVPRWGTRPNLLFPFWKIHQGYENEFNLIFFLLGVGTFHHELDEHGAKRVLELLAEFINRDRYSWHLPIFSVRSQRFTDLVRLILDGDTGEGFGQSLGGVISFLY
jgi:hypothetical protein